MRLQELSRSRRNDFETFEISSINKIDRVHPTMITFAFLQISMTRSSSKAINHFPCSTAKYLARETSKLANNNNVWQHKKWGRQDFVATNVKIATWIANFRSRQRKKELSISVRIKNIKITNFSSLYHTNGGDSITQISTDICSAFSTSWGGRWAEKTPKSKHDVMQIN